jgi:hypothetical protein
MENNFQDFVDENYWLTNTCILLYIKTIMDLLPAVLTRKSDIDRGEDEAYSICEFDNGAKIEIQRTCIS